METKFTKTCISVVSVLPMGISRVLIHDCVRCVAKQTESAASESAPYCLESLLEIYGVHSAVCSPVVYCYCKPIFLLPPRRDHYTAIVRAPPLATILRHSFLFHSISAFFQLVIFCRPKVC